LNSAATLTNDLLHSAIRATASDIHFYPFLQHTDIYFRIHGERVLFETISISNYQLVLAYFKFTSGMDIGEIRKPQNGTITHEELESSYSLRLSTLPVHRMESLAIRILPLEETYTLDKLFLFPSQLKVLKKWINHRAGLLLFSGPTGSGKSTTLYALLETILQNKSYQAITLEDPVEKKMNHLLQVQINEKAGITYETGLKAALRHDPDIIMVGEIRDKHTAHFCFEAALTGHLVFSTLHAKSAVGTIHRLLDMGIQQIELEQSLIAVASIQLLPIQIAGKIERQAAILEILEGQGLVRELKGGDHQTSDHTQSFYHLRKKAFAYGFISKETFLSR